MELHPQSNEQSHPEGFKDTYGTGEMESLDWDRYASVGLRSLSIPVPGVPQHAGPGTLLKVFCHAAIVPVLDEAGKILGVLEDRHYLNAPGIAIDCLSRASTEFSLSTVLQETETLPDIKHRLVQSSATLFPLVEGPSGRYTGRCVSKQNIFKLLYSQKKPPPRIGGMATPLGVYMTYGRFTSGPGMLGLFTTGALFAVTLNALDGLFLMVWSAICFQWPFFLQLDPNPVALLHLGFMFSGLLLAIRWSPISGLHAAEHMTINAIENGLPLNLEAVRTQPRQHIRCGTNLMALLALLELGWLATECLRPYLSGTGAFIYTLLWVIGVAASWRKLGFWFQTYFTTKPPTDAQLMSGIRAGQGIMERYQAENLPKPTWLHRIWGSGILQIMAAFFLTHQLIAWGWPYALEVLIP